MDKKLLENMSGQELKEMINNEKITLEELDNNALEKLMNFEIDKICFGTDDMELIDRCSLLLNERNACDSLNEETIVSAIDKAQQEHVIIVDEKQNTPKAKVIRKRNIVLRRIGLVAAIITLLAATTTLVAASFGFNVLEYLGIIIHEEPGTKIDIYEYTFYNNGEPRRYSDIDVMMETEDLDVAYPTQWPEGIRLETVQSNKSVHGGKSISFVTSNSNVGMVIETNMKKPEEPAPEDSIYEHNGFSCYIFNDGELYFASFYYRDYYYCIHANTYDEVVIIFNSLKE